MADNVTPAELISDDRIRKFELFVHLLANLDQPLILCGQEGVGKTTYLNILQDQRIDGWQYCFIQGHSDLSFEAIQEQLSAALHIDKRSLLVALDRYVRQNRKIVLMIDDAGALIDGLAYMLMQYTISNPSLRLVFTLTPEELTYKQQHETAFYDCHVIDIPKFTENDCCVFLKHLTHKSWVKLTERDIDDVMVEKMYRLSQGLPAGIIAELPNLNKKSFLSTKSIVFIAVTALVLITISLRWQNQTMPLDKVALPDNIEKSVEQKQSVIESELAETEEPATTSAVEPESDAELELALKSEPMPDSEVKLGQVIEAVKEAELETPPKIVEPKETPIVVEKIVEKPQEPKIEKPLEKETPSEIVTVTPLTEKPVEKTAIAPPIMALNNTVTESPVKKAESNVQNPPVVEKTTVKNSEKSVEKMIKKTEKVIEKPIITKSVEKEATSPVIASTSQIEEDNVIQEEHNRWLSSQDKSNFTLKLKTLDKLSEFKELRKKYPRHNLRVIKKEIEGKQKYVLIYGSFTNPEVVERAKKLLPPEFSSVTTQTIETIK